VKISHLGRQVGDAFKRRFLVKSVGSRLDTAIASITFDDIPVSAASVGARILDDAGVAGTFYVCSGTMSKTNAGLAQASLEQVAALHEHGHEIGCHTFSHHNASAISADDFIADIRRNLDFFAQAMPKAKLRNFAYPYGAWTIRTKARSSRMFQTCRGVTPGLNSDIADLADLRSVILTDLNFNEQDVLDWIAAAKASGAWLIFFTHDVSDTPSEWGCRPEQLRFVVEALKSASVEIMTVADGAERFAGNASPRPRLARRAPHSAYGFPPGRMPLTYA
jgi:peptidoglycan/xylan/chitin deacetylase (PgdA/CDA1 family)